MIANLFSHILIYSFKILSFFYLAGKTYEQNLKETDAYRTKGFSYYPSLWLHIFKFYTSSAKISLIIKPSCVNHVFL